jgi:uncharacterized protein YecE (DUF72 family)
MSIEINGMYYSTLKPQSWREWHNDTARQYRFLGEGVALLH